MTGERPFLLVSECWWSVLTRAWRVRNLKAFLCLLPLLRVSYWDLFVYRLWISLCRTGRWINIEWLAYWKFYIDVPTIAGILFMSFSVAVHDKEIVFLFLDRMCH